MISTQSVQSIPLSIEALMASEIGGADQELVAANDAAMEPAKPAGLKRHHFAGGDKLAALTQSALDDAQGVAALL